MGAVPCCTLMSMVWRWCAALACCRRLDGHTIASGPVGDAVEVITSHPGTPDTASANESKVSPTAVSSGTRPRASSSGTPSATTLPDAKALSMARDAGDEPFLSINLSVCKPISTSKVLADGSFDVVETVASMLVFKSERKVTLKGGALM